MLYFYSNHPTAPDILPDTCETCESYNNGMKAGHHTFLAIDWGSGLSDGTCIWFCSKKCYEMSPVPIMESIKL